MPQGCYTVIFSRDNCFATNKYTDSKMFCQVSRKTFLDKSKQGQTSRMPMSAVSATVQVGQTTTDAK
jgi:hypothetical protein